MVIIIIFTSIFHNNVIKISSSCGKFSNPIKHVKVTGIFDNLTTLHMGWCNFNELLKPFPFATFTDEYTWMLQGTTNIIMGWRVGYDCTALQTMEMSSVWWYCGKKRRRISFVGIMYSEGNQGPAVNGDITVHVINWAILIMIITLQTCQNMFD